MNEREYQKAFSKMISKSNITMLQKLLFASKDVCKSFVPTCDDEIEKYMILRVTLLSSVSADVRNKL